VTGRWWAGANMVDRRTGAEHDTRAGHPLGGAGAVSARLRTGVAARAGRAAAGSPRRRSTTTSHQGGHPGQPGDEFAARGRAAWPWGRSQPAGPDTGGSCCAATPSCSMPHGRLSVPGRRPGRAARDARRDGGTPAADELPGCSPRAVRARSAMSTPPPRCAPACPWPRSHGGNRRPQLHDAEMPPNHSRREHRPTDTRESAHASGVVLSPGVACRGASGRGGSGSGPGPPVGVSWKRFVAQGRPAYSVRSCPGPAAPG